MKQFGLIGKKLSHSFSAKYFTEKFQREGLHDHRYDLFELGSVDEISGIFELKDLIGLNVTLPYKQQVIPYLDYLDASASKVGAVNVIKIKGNTRIGYNSDYTGFRVSLERWVNSRPEKALVLGTGGASRAVTAVLSDLGIEYKLVSRTGSPDHLTYPQLNCDIVSSHKLVINTTPLGMFPNISSAPDIPYNCLSSDHYLYDLVYNPENTRFMTLGMENGAQVKNGLEMLYVQAERSWEIWNTN